MLMHLWYLLRYSHYVVVEVWISYFAKHTLWYRLNCVVGQCGWTNYQKNVFQLIYSKHTCPFIVTQHHSLYMRFKERNFQNLGHVMLNPKYRILQLNLQGHVKGRRGPDRGSRSWLRNLRVWFGLTSIEHFRMSNR